MNEGALTAAACFPIACAVAAAVFAVSIPTDYRRAGIWFAVALVGQAAMLQLAEAGPFVRYQHYPPLGQLVSTHPRLLLLIAIQSLAVALTLAMRVGKGVGVRAERWPVWRVGAAVALSVCTAATVSPSVPRYVAELAFAAYLQVLSIATIIVMALPLPDDVQLGTQLTSPFRRLSDEDSPTARQHGDRIVWGAAAGAMVLAVAINVFSYERHPHIADEVADLYHARYFAAGMITMPAPPSAAAFDMDLMYYEPTRWFSPVAPGWPAVLAVGVKAGVPWLVNPVLAGVNVLLTYMLLAQLYPRRLARAATLLLAVSPWYLFLGMSLMTHTVTLTFALVAALAVMQARRSGTFGWGAIAGAAIGATSLVRPLDGAIIGVLMMVWAAGIGGARLKLSSLSGIVAGTVAVGGLVLPYNYWLVGRATEFPINTYFDKYYHPNANALGFGADRGMGWAIDPNPGHSLLDGLINANLNTFSLNTDLFGWSTGSLVLIALFICLGRFSRSDRLMLATIALVFVPHLFYYFAGGPDFGARYWFLIIVPLVALTARGGQLLEQMAGPRVGVAMAALVAMALINFVPWRAIDKYHHYRGMRAGVSALAKEHHFARDLVLVRGDRFPDYASAVNENPIDLASDATIYAWDRNSEVRAEALRAYPDRRVWFVDGPSITGAGYRIADGPVMAAALLAGDPSR